MIKDYNVPLDEAQCRKIREAIVKRESLAEITREATVWRVVNHLIEDKSSLELYLKEMAGVFTKQRQQISFQIFTASIFHIRQKRRYLNKDFLALLDGILDKERETQAYVFIQENHRQVNIGSDVWKMYERYGDVLRLTSLDFSLIQRPSLRYELKYYLKYIFEHTGKITRTIFDPQVMAINALTTVNPKIIYFADITETDARAMLLFLESNYKKSDGSLLSQKTIASAMMNAERIVEYLTGWMRDGEIRTPRPHTNPFSIFVFHNQREYTTPTSAIPEDVIEQINSYAEELPPLFKLLYDIFTNTGLRVKEVFFLETDCIEPSHYDGICQLRFKPHKVIAARRRHRAGDYHRVMIQQSLADKISCHIADTAHLRATNESRYIFLSQKNGYSKAIINPAQFMKSVRDIIAKHDIRDENGELWHLTNMQYRKTIAVTLIENGATTTELAYWLGHMCSTTAARYYAEVRKVKLAELNTKFFKERFDLIISGEQLEEYTEEERKLLYVDFRLEQRRVELGYCLIKAADGRCPNRDSLYNCVNCKNLCTGKKYLPYWNELLTQQQTIFETLINTYHVNGVDEYTEFAEYKQELHLLGGYESIVSAINEGGISND